MTSSICYQENWNFNTTSKRFVNSFGSIDMSSFNKPKQKAKTNKKR